MKIKILTFLTCLLITVGSFAQYNFSSSEPSGFATATEASQMADQIVKAVGLKANFQVAEAQVSNALAVLHQGKRYILYNRNFIDALTKVTGTKWAAISVLAHEIGHHLYNKTPRYGTPTLSTELEADEFSGYVLEKMGATLQEAEAAMKMLATNYATRTHPAKNDRLNSIALGWKNAGGVDTEEEEDEQPEYSQPERQSIIPRENIAATLFFNASPNNTYYVTKRLNVIQVSNQQVTMIGHLSRSNSRDYPYIISDNNGYRLYIDNSGRILNADGKTVGTIKTDEDS